MPMNGETRETGRFCEDCGKPLFEGYIQAFESGKWYNLACPDCSKKAKEAAEIRKSRESQERRIKAAAFPPFLLSASFDGYKVPPGSGVALEKCRKYAERFADFKESGVGMVLKGCTGSGKSHLAVAIGKEVVNAGYSVRYWNVDNLLKSIRATYDGYGETEAGILRPCNRCSLLILDDLGAENDNSSEWRRSVLYGIVESRYSSLLPTIITTNLELADLERTLDPRTYSRLSDQNHYRYITLECADYRRKR